MVQFCGTESTPNVAARPAPALMAALLTEPKAPWLIPPGSAELQI